MRIAYDALVNLREYDKFAETAAFTRDGISVLLELEIHCGPADTLMLSDRLRTR